MVDAQCQLIPPEGIGRIADITLAVFFKPGRLGLHPDTVALAPRTAARGLSHRAGCRCLRVRIRRRRQRLQLP